MSDEKKVAPVTHVRIMIPEGMRIEDVISKVEVSFETAPASGEEINTSFCCVDASVLGPVSAVSYAPKTRSTQV